MNYIILNNKDFFKDKINIEKLKEVDLNDEERVDAVFGEITTELLEDIISESESGNPILRNEWLLKNRGIAFMVFKTDRSILYNENDELIEKMFGLFSKDDFFIELWSLNIEDSYNQLDSYLIIYNKNFGWQQIISSYDEDKKDHFKMILKKIEEKIL